MRLIVAGSRTFTDYNLLRDKLLHLLSNTPLDQVTILSGAAKGADQLGERFADEFNINLEKYPADWDQYGKSAGYHRNVKMAEEADALVAFWDGKSPGTKMMIQFARELRLKVRVIRVTITPPEIPPRRRGL